uniref:Uncharacterized protein n=1 Tax=Phakopsora pachyrhizi TaxID=170000 RepID=A0A0S1MJS4_PHAPC
MDRLFVFFVSSFSFLVFSLSTLSDFQPSSMHTAFIS